MSRPDLDHLPGVAMIWCSGLFAIGRLLLPNMPLDWSPLSVMKDMSHIFVGVLIGATWRPARTASCTPAWRCA